MAETGAVRMNLSLPGPHLTGSSPSRITMEKTQKRQMMDLIPLDLIGTSPLDPGGRTLAFAAAEAAIDRCRLCVDAGFPVEPRPINRGRVDAPILVIGQAPGRREKERGLPFIGPSGRRLMAG